MKTKALSLILCVAMLLSVCALAISAVAPTSQTKLKSCEAWPADYASMEKISEGLTSFGGFTSDYWGARTPFTAEQKAEMANMSKYGLTAYGIAASERALSVMTDGYFNNNGSPLTGSYGFFGDSETYNYLGETGKADSIYQTVITMNFGEIYNLEYLTFLAGNNQVAAAADIYVSNDGEKWTNIGYYDVLEDLIEMKKTGSADNNVGIWGGTQYNLTDLKGDKSGGSGTNFNHIWIDLNGIKAQYLRICNTTAALPNPGNLNVDNYEANLSNTTQVCGREMIVFGTEVVEEGPIKPVADTKLKSCEAWPTDYSTMTRISEGLSAFRGFTSDYWGARTPFTAAQKAEMADMSKYGLTAYGIASSERALSVMTDGYFNNNGSPLTGSYGYYTDDQTYNYLGQTGKDDSIYQTVITMNFGKIYNLEYLTFLAGNNQVAAAADLYISNDGVNWTPVGYYDVLEDLIEMKKTGSTDGNVGIWGGPQYNLTDLKGDKSGGSGTNFNHIWIDLGEGVQAQYLRICHTTAALPNTSNINVDNYGANLSNTTQICGREMIVYGTDAGVDYRGVQLSDADENGNFDARFIASVDSLDYAKAGFEMKLTYFTANKTEGVSSTVAPYYVSTVYTSINTYNGVYKDANGYYLMALTVEDIPAAVTKLVVEIRAFCENEAGEKCYDDWYEVTLVAGQTPAQVKK